MTLHHHPPPIHTNSMSAMSQLLLTQFWWNSKGRILWTSRTNYNCHCDICPCNICLGDICLYQEYLRCYWPDFYQNFCTQCFEGPILFGSTFFWTKHLLPQLCFWKNKSFAQKSFYLEFIRIQNFVFDQIPIIWLWNELFGLMCHIPMFQIPVCTPQGGMDAKSLDS